MRSVSESGKGEGGGGSGEGESEVKKEKTTEGQRLDWILQILSRNENNSCRLSRIHRNK